MKKKRSKIWGGALLVLGLSTIVLSFLAMPTPSMQDPVWIPVVGVLLTLFGYILWREARSYQ